MPPKKRTPIVQYCATLVPEIHEDIISKVIESLRDTFLTDDTDLNNLSKLEESWRENLEKAKSKPEIITELPSDSHLILKQVGGYKLLRFAVSDHPLSVHEVEEQYLDALEYLKSMGINFSPNKAFLWQTDGAISDDDDDDQNGDEDNADYLNDPNHVTDDNISKLEEIDAFVNFDITKIKKEKVDVKGESLQMDCNDSDDDDDFICVEELPENNIKIDTSINKIKMDIIKTKEEKVDVKGESLQMDCSDSDDDDDFICVEDLPENKIKIDESKIKMEPRESIENYDDVSDDENFDIKDIKIIKDELTVQPVRRENIVEFSDELNSDDDQEDLDINTWTDCENTVYCTATKIKKTKKTHNFTINIAEGFMNVKGRDLVFKSLYCKQMWSGSRYFGGE